MSGKRESRKRLHGSVDSRTGGEQQQIMPEINKRYVCEKIDPDKVERQTAVILHMEYRSQAPPLLIDDEDGNEKETKEEQELMYYVHYEKLDRRNDEWIPLERVLVNEPVEPEMVNAIIIPDEIKKEGGPQTPHTPSGALTRSQRRNLEEYSHLKSAVNGLDATTARLEKEHEERTKIKNIPRITIGAHTINSWYYSPFPPFCENHEIFMCEYCLLYTPHKSKFKTHLTTCKVRQPPGIEIYRKSNLSVYEVDGSGQKLYCQCLCLLSKLFMDHKTLYFDVDDFMFYVLCETDSSGAHIVGYFSREVESANNLACIMVFPPFQKNGYGKLLIQLSYDLSKREGYIGTPEKPLSDLGKVSYRSYWWWILMKLFHIHQGHTVTATFLAQQSGIHVDDIVSTLQTMRMVRQYKEPEFVPGEWYVRIHRKVVEHCVLNEYGKPPGLLLDNSKVRWGPQMTRWEYNRKHQKPASTNRRASKSQAGTPMATPPIDGLKGDEASAETLTTVPESFEFFKADSSAT
uniref:Histone acetyltransferase n=1 Tax=Caenorhabditis tropicalis TaxID=1561998 RepID=A0A1I7T6X6_9PELO